MKNIILSLIVLLGILSLGYAFKKQFDSAESYNFALTKGIITKYEIASHFHNYSQYGTKPTNVYSIIYKYNVNRQEYYSTVISYDVVKEKQAIKQYSKNMEVDVYYNKENPSEAVLIPETYKIYNSEYFFVGILAIISGLFGFFLNLRYKNYKSPAQEWKAISERMKEQQNFNKKKKKYL